MISLCRCRGGRPLPYLLAVVLIVCVAMVRPTSAESPADAIQCMEQQAGVDSITIATRSSERLPGRLSISAPGVVFLGCFRFDALPLEEGVNITQLEDETVDDLVPPSLNDTLQCASQCGQNSNLVHGSSNALVVTPFYVTANGTSCVCVNATVGLLPLAIAGANITDQCPLDKARLFYLQLPCSLNTTGDCGDGCSLQGACCLPNPAPGDELPSYYRTMIQWLAVIVIVLAVLEAIVYMCVRRRLRQRAERNARGGGGGGGGGGGLTGDRLRGKSEAKDLTERLLRGFPASPTGGADGYQEGDEDACPICLEALRDAPSLQLPCRHNIHRTCLRDFVTHALVRSNEAGCPLCRAPIVGVQDVQTLLEGSSTPTARRTAINATEDDV